MGSVVFYKWPVLKKGSKIKISPGLLRYDPNKGRFSSVFQNKKDLTGFTFSLHSKVYIESKPFKILHTNLSAKPQISTRIVEFTETSFSLLRSNNKKKLSILFSWKTVLYRLKLFSQTEDFLFDYQFYTLIIFFVVYQDAIIYLWPH